MGKEIAKLFFDQCVGEHNGHMASIPNNPVIKSIFIACDYKYSNKSFAEIIRGFADILEKTEEDALF